MPAFQLKSPSWQGKPKLTTLEIGALQSGGDSRLAVTLNTQYMQGAFIKKNLLVNSMWQGHRGSQWQNLYNLFADLNHKNRDVCNTYGF